MKKERKEKLMKKFKVKTTKAFWLYFVLAGLFVIAAVLFAPFWLKISADIPWASWSNYALGILVGLLILLYIFLILLRRLKQSGLAKVTRFAMGFEFGLMIVFSVLAILKGILYDNPKFKFLNTCEILAIIIWVRGVVEIINAYYHDHNSNVKYPVWFLFVNILLITVAPLLYVVAIKYDTKVDTIVSYVISGVLLLIGAYFIFYGILCMPERIKKEKKVKEEPQLIEQEQPADLDNFVLETKQDENNETLEETNEPLFVENNQEIAEDDGLVEQVSPVELISNETVSQEETALTEDNNEK